MANGRLEKETIEFNKIENKIKSLPKIFGDYYYTLRAEKKSYRTIEEYINSVKMILEAGDKDKLMELIQNKLNIQMQSIEKEIDERLKTQK